MSETITNENGPENDPQTNLPARMNPSDVYDRLELLASGEDAPVQMVYTRPKPNEALKEKDAKAYRAEVMAYAAEVSQFFGQADYRAQDAVNKTILLRNVFGHRARVRQEDGSYVPIDRVVLIDANGETYEAVSGGLIDSLLILFQLPGIGHPSKWEEPLPVVIKSVAVRNTWRTFKLEVVNDVPDKESTSKRR